MFLRLNRINYFVTISKMSTFVEGKLTYPKDQLNLDLTLLGGQSFRWEKRINEKGEKWQGVAFGSFWELQQTPTTIMFKVLSTQEHSKEYFMG